MNWVEVVKAFKNIFNQHSNIKYAGLVLVSETTVFLATLGVNFWPKILSPVASYRHFNTRTIWFDVPTPKLYWDWILSWGWSSVRELSCQAQGGYNYQVSAHFGQEQTDWSFYSVCNDIGLFMVLFMQGSCVLCMGLLPLLLKRHNKPRSLTLDNQKATRSPFVVDWCGAMRDRSANFRSSLFCHSFQQTLPDRRAVKFWLPTYSKLRSDISEILRWDSN